MKKFPQAGRKHCGKRRYCSSRAISHFSHSAFRRLLLQARENNDLFGKLKRMAQLFHKSLPLDEILDLSKLKAFVDYKLNVVRYMDVDRLFICDDRKYFGKKK